MTALERLENLLAGKEIDRPPFMPAIYDLKPAFVQSSSHTFGQNKQEIIDALTFEVEQLDADALTSAYDIYNIEAEAVGCKVNRDPGIWMPEIAKPLLSSTSRVDDLKGLEQIAGRMGIYIQAAQAMLQKYGHCIPVRGGISGPFSMATKIYPKEKLLMESLMDPEGLVPLLRFCTETIKIYAKALGDIGAGVVVFDSFVSPPLLSPQTYHDLVLPFHKEIFDLLEYMRVQQRTLIVGGDTRPILHDILSTGANQFLLDFTIPPEEIKTVFQEYPDTIFRVNLPPAPFADSNSEQLITVVDKLLHSLNYYTNFIIGTGILPPGVSANTLRTVKEYIVNSFK